MSSNFRNYGMFDKSLELRDVANGAETSTAAEAGIELQVRKLDVYKAKVLVTEVDVANSDETYQFNVEVSDASDGTFTSIAELSFAAGTLTAGSYDIPLSGVLVDQMDGDANWVRVKATLGGTTPSVTYGSYLTKI